MKISQAQERVKQLQAQVDNLKKLQQYASENPDKMEEIADKMSINTPINMLLIDTIDEISTTKSKIEMAINNADIDLN